MKPIIQTRRQGAPISLEDIYIEAIAIHHDFTVVTSNTNVLSTSP